MPTKMTDAQLREWYARFAKELREKASIDVTRIEDVGRVKNFAIKEWGSLDNPYAYEGAIVGEPTYAFMPHEGDTCLAVPPKNVTYDDYKVWLTTNLSTELDIDHIQTLYNMSRAGTLMVMQPGVGAENFQQVYTDKNGVITTSKPALSYADEFSKANNKGKTNWLKMPEYVPAPKPADYGLPAEPVLPPRPKNMNPGFWSWLGHLLGLDTDYAKMVKYNEAMKAYGAAKTAWDDRLNGPEGETFRAARDVRAQFVRDMQQYRERPLAIMNGIAFGYQEYVFNITRDADDMKVPEELLYRTLMIQEDADLVKEHYRTPLGKLNKNVETLKGQLNNMVKRTGKAIDLLLSASSAGEPIEAWYMKGVFEPDDYQPKEYSLPPCPLIDPNKKQRELTVEELRIKNAWKADMNKLSGLACFAALADPKVIGEPAKENYSRLLSSLFTVGIPNSKDQLNYLAPAREMGMNALVDYINGKPEKLANMLSNCLHQLINELADKKDLRDEHTVNTMFLVDHLMKTLDKKNDLWNHTDLDIGDITDISENRALLDVIRKGREARLAIAEHASYKKDLSAEQLKEAVINILFADTIINGYAEGIVFDITTPEAVEAAKRDLINERNVDKVASMDREDLGRLNLNLLDFVTAFPAKKQQSSSMQQDLSRGKAVENNVEKGSNQQQIKI